MALSATHLDESFHIGDNVRIHQRIKEDKNTKTQVFEGMVISIRGDKDNKMFTVRRIGAGNIGIERIFPLASPLIDKVEVASKGRVRRSKLYYLRDKSTREVAEITKKKKQPDKINNKRSK